MADTQKITPIPPTKLGLNSAEDFEQIRNSTGTSSPLGGSSWTNDTVVFSTAPKAELPSALAFPSAYPGHGGPLIAPFGPLDSPRFIPKPNVPTHPAPPTGQNPLITSILGGLQRGAEGQKAPLPANILALLAKPVSHFKDNPSDTEAGQQALTQIAFVLDCSSSMQKDKEVTVVGFNKQVETVREGAHLAGETRFSEVHFGSTVEIRCLSAALDELKPLTMTDYVTEGWTALYDALGDTISALLATEGINSPKTAVLVTAFTDGDDNLSRMYGTSILKAVIQRLEATGRWTFVLVGPNNSVSALARNLAVQPENIAGFDVTDRTDKLKAFDKISGASASYMAMRSMGLTQSTCLYAEPESSPKG